MNWIQFKSALKTRWARFRDDHLVQTERSYDKFIDKAHERSGDKQDELMKGADQWHQQLAPEAVGEMSPEWMRSTSDI